MRETLNRARVDGFLDVRGRSLINGRSEEILLSGWNLGNWLVCEGYMWNAGAIPQFDRPRRIEAALDTLTGKPWTERFWKRFRETYIQETDIQMMAEMGYNSVRIPFSSRLLLKDGPGNDLLDNGFDLLDQVIDWCEQYGIYAFLDMHAAPGGQTGANMDDSLDDLCRLLIDDEQFEKGLALWEAIAQRYRDRWIVGGYDLLNEPIRTARFDGDTSLDEYLPRLGEFYEQCIARIRAVDNRHIIALEGHHWSTEVDLFDHVWDSRMVIQFHRYGCAPDLASFEPYLKAAERLQVPLWLGETGENSLTWIAAVTELAFQLGISVTLWPWKRMEADCAPCSVIKPKEWDVLTGYLRGGKHPGYEKAQAILNEYLRNVDVDRCLINDQVTSQVFRMTGCEVSGTDFDEFPGEGETWQWGEWHEPWMEYRKNTGMELVIRHPENGSRFDFDGPWSQTVLRLHEGESASYTFYDISSHSGLEISCYADEPARVAVYQNDELLGLFDLSGTQYPQVISGMYLRMAEKAVVRVSAIMGYLDVDTLYTISKG